MDKVILKQLEKIARKEMRQCNSTADMDLKMVTKTIEAKIPPELHKKLEHGFYLGFRTVFQSGTGIIEKTYQKEKCQKEYYIGNFAFDTFRNKKGLRSINAVSNRRRMTNLGATTLEGVGLGVLGIGLPDIPIFIGVLLKSVYEIALSYGFDYESEEEKYYILLLIMSALGSGEKKLQLYGRIDEVAAKNDANVEISFDLDLQIRETAQALSTDLLVMKFIQGIPIVGIVGGATNAFYCHKVTDFAKMKYQKRYLLKKAGI